MKTKTYIIDAGHGGINPQTGDYVTPGKRSSWSDGTVFYEGVNNRDIAKKVGDQLKKLGIPFYYTVTPSEWQDVSLTERVARANKICDKGDAVLISIHSNAGPTMPSSANGFEVFTSPGNTKSDQYAQIWFNEMKAEFPDLKGRSDLSDGDHDKEERFTMVTGPKCPAFLIESMFYTNQKEVKLLLDPKVQERIANTIVRTIQKINAL